MQLILLLYVKWFETAVRYQFFFSTERPHSAQSVQKSMFDWLSGNNEIINVIMGKKINKNQEEQFY